MRRPAVISLFDYSGVWAQPWVDDGRFAVYTFDRQRSALEDVFELNPDDYADVRLVLAAPPCTHFTVASNRNWPQYDADGRTAASVALVEQTLALIEAWAPAVWALENPKVGRLPRLVPALRDVSHWDFSPWQFAGWADDPASEAYQKSTRIWGTAERPEERPVARADVLGTGGKQTAVSWVSPGKDRANIRSKTPQGFARAFYAANVGLLGT